MQIDFAGCTTSWPIWNDYGYRQKGLSFSNCVDACLNRKYLDCSTYCLCFCWWYLLLIQASNRKLLEQLVACNDIALLVRKDIDSILNTPVISKLNVRRPHVEAQYKDAGHSDLHNRPIICGSFNPIHHGHTQMVRFLHMRLLCFGLVKSRCWKFLIMFDTFLFGQAEAASKRCAASAMYEMSVRLKEFQIYPLESHPNLTDPPRFSADCRVFGTLALCRHYLHGGL